MRRFIVTYRWELLLLLGIPAAGWIVRIPTRLALEAFAAHNDISSSTLSFPDTYASFGVGLLVEALLLGVSYGRVRRLRRDLLPLIWGYSLASAAIAAPIYLVGAALWLTVDDPNASTFGFWSTGVSLTGVILALPLLIWFVRQASRFSLRHAFFLTLISGFLIVPTGMSLFSFVGIGVSFAVTFVAVWLLGNFETRGQAFRKRAVVGVLVLNGFGSLMVWVLPIATSGVLALRLGTLISGATVMGTYVLGVILKLGLVYLVRVQQPVPAEPPPAPSDVR